MSESLPKGYTIINQDDECPRLVCHDGQSLPIDLVNRTLPEIDDLFGNHLINSIEKKLEDSHGSINILDCPSGTMALAAATIAQQYPDARVYAADLLAPKKCFASNLQALPADIYHLPIKSNSIDLAYCYGWFYYLHTEGHNEKIEATLLEFVRVLAPDGLALIHANYGEIMKTCNREGEFERRNNVSLEPLKGNLSFLNQILIYLQVGWWMDKRFVLMKKLP